MNTLERKKSVNDKSQYILELMVKHAPADGKLSIFDLDAKEPGWDSRVPSRKWASSRIYAFASSGRFAYEKARATNSLPVLQEVPANGSLSPIQQRALEAYNRFRKPNGTVDWGRVKAEDPELAKDLSYDGKGKSFLKGSQQLHELRKKHLIPDKVYYTTQKHKKVKNLKQRKLLKLAAAEPVRMSEDEVMKRVEQAMAGMSYCPRCGNGLLALQRAIMFQLKGN